MTHFLAFYGCFRAFDHFLLVKIKCSREVHYSFIYLCSGIGQWLYLFLYSCVSWPVDGFKITQADSRSFWLKLLNISMSLALPPVLLYKESIRLYILCHKGPVTSAKLKHQFIVQFYFLKMYFWKHKWHSYNFIVCLICCRHHNFLSIAWHLARHYSTVM